MAADLHIHVLTDEFTEEHYKAFQSNVIGGKYWGGFNRNLQAEFEKKHNCDLYLLCCETPSVWVGEVSWLKAALSEDPDTWVPATVQAVYDIIGEDFPVIDDELIAKIEAALGLDNATGYSICEHSGVIDFLKEHKGKKAFHISW